MSANDKNVLIADDCNKIVDRSDSETSLEEMWEWYTVAVHSQVGGDQHRPVCTRVYNEDGQLLLLEIDDESGSK